MILSLIYIGLLIIYTIVVIIVPLIGWFDVYKKKLQVNPTIDGITIIIPFKNEINNLNDLCLKLEQLSYPTESFEVIFIDDNSSDNGSELIRSALKKIQFKIIELKDATGKKHAIEAGIEEAKYDLILTIDADCQPPEGLLQSIQADQDLSIGVVIKTTPGYGLIANFQEIESLMLAGITVGTANIDIPSLSSGANLAYKKSFFKTLSPYENNYQINSGDDMFLLKSAQEYGAKIKCRPQPYIATKTEKNWKNYVTQATRWAGKNNEVGLLQATINSWVVLFTNITLPFALISDWQLGWNILFIKFAVDFLFLFLTATFYKRYKALIFAPLMIFFYPIHIALVTYELIKSGNTPDHKK